MDRSRRRRLGGALIFVSCLALATGGCSRAPSPTPPSPRVPTLARGVGDGRHLVLEARPSAEVAAMLPAHARYRLVLSARGELGLAVLGPDDRIHGHWRVRPRLSARRAQLGVRVEFEAGAGAQTVEAWSFGGGLEGRSSGTEAASWRVSMGTSGQLAGKSWRVEGPHRRATELRRARAIGADVQALIASLIEAGQLCEPGPCELTDQLALAQSAIELSIRAVEGHGRSSLPTLASLIPEASLCE